MSPYLSFKIISVAILLVVMVVVLISKKSDTLPVVLSNQHGKKDEGAADCNIQEDAFQTWIKHVSIYDMQRC